MKLNKMDTAPKDRDILVYAKWNWSGYEETEEYTWKVAYHDENLNFCDETETYLGGFHSVTENPYEDQSCEEKYWVELPEVGE